MTTHAKTAGTATSASTLYERMHVDILAGRSLFTEPAVHGIDWEAV
jgi:hypothetical protein